MTYKVVAQAQKKVKGQVIDATGEPLIGVNISVIGGTEGTITDIDGNYAINVPAGAKLKFSYIGYKDQIIDVAAQTVINVKLQEDSEVLDEVVVVGYGSIAAEASFKKLIDSISAEFNRRSSFTLSYSTPSMITNGSVELADTAPRSFIPQLSSPGAPEERVMITPGTCPCKACTGGESL